MKIQSMMKAADRRRLTDAAIAALEKVAADLGLTVEAKGGTYDAGHFTTKFRFCCVGDDGVAITPERENFSKYAEMYDLSPDDLGRTFRSHGKVFTIAGLNTRARKRPILCDADDGKTYTFREDDVRRLLSLEKAGR